jgi:SAM-dependent methyltransferase
MKRNCAVCGSRQSKLLYHQRFVLPTRNYFHGGYDVVACARCGFTFADNTPPQAFLDTYYREMSKKRALLQQQAEKGLVEPDYVIRQHEHSITNILAHVHKNDSILDVGCYTGNLLSMLKTKGFAKVKGLDPSPFAAEVAKEKHGIDVVTGSLFDELPVGVFDFVILTHVLEHIAELTSFLSRLKTLMNENGLLYVEVPDANNFFYSDSPDHLAEHKEPFQQFSVEHINYFGAVSVVNLMEAHGFEKVFIQPQVSTLAVIASVWSCRAVGMDTQTADSLRSYIRESRERLASVTAVIDKLVQSKAEIIVWGAGLHTQKLLAAGALAEGKIAAFVDSDPAYHGGLLLGKPILPPQEIPRLGDLPILVSSKLHQESIASQIRNMGLNNQVVLLYSGDENS